ncbi:MAG TPA: ABC transporter ATP-binding protein [Acidimicrobiales bacterium]|jgi:ABC-2 type transport system ATP-binding protein|nr:ABC transporter ATP-binding protein [Acidimicrobiales bacterium]
MAIAASVGTPALDPDPSTVEPVPVVDTVVLSGVSRSFGENPALRELDLRVPQARITVLLGPNGAGKTTAIRMITGALDPDAGEVCVFGQDPNVDGESVRRRCGVVSAKPSLYDRLSGYDNLAYAAELYGLGRGPKAADVIRAAAARFGIDHALAQQAGGYSTGMKTRLALARSVLHEPDLLLFDEPTSGLDPESSHAVLELIREMTATGATVVMCTHLLLEAEGLADQVVVLEDGHALISGTPDELTARFWPGAVVHLDAEDPGVLDRLAQAEGVLAYERVDGAPATVQLDDMSRVPDLVLALTREGVRLTRVEPHTPTLEDLYFAVRGRSRPGVVPRDQTPLDKKRLSSGNRLGRRFSDPFRAS